MPARYSVGDKRRTNPNEATKIKQYVLSHPNEDIGILTPYNHQKDLIKQQLPGFENIMTVHASQGREWDTVLFSVVDTYNKWFTTTKFPERGGKQVLNTVISRARKKLVVICDYGYWTNVDNGEELIYKLL